MIELLRNGGIPIYFVLLLGLPVVQASPPTEGATPG